MKSYLQGIITGGVLVFAILVFMGANHSKSEVGRYDLQKLQWQIIDGEGTTEFDQLVLFDTSNGNVFWKPHGKKIWIPLMRSQFRHQYDELGEMK
tara:strand:+ start:36 stop:320 length:285 start_codon:yes stop_codon:yes gene_type:complete